MCRDRFGHRCSRIQSRPCPSVVDGVFGWVGARLVGVVGGAAVDAAAAPGVVDRRPILVDTRSGGVIAGRAGVVTAATKWTCVVCRGCRVVVARCVVVVGVHVSALCCVSMRSQILRSRLRRPPIRRCAEEQKNEESASASGRCGLDGVPSVGQLAAFSAPAGSSTYARLPRPLKVSESCGSFSSTGTTSIRSDYRGRMGVRSSGPLA